MNLTELFTPAAIAANWQETASNRIPYMGEAFFPSAKKAGLDLRWIKGSRGLPVSLMPSAFDAKATFRDRPGMTITETEMPFFREGFKVKERDRQELLRVRESNDPYLNEILSNLFRDSEDLIDAAEVVKERERFQLLFSANGNIGITIKANGVDYTYNYDPNGDWKATNYMPLSGTAVWTAPTTADPMKNFKDAKDIIASKTGSTPAIALMNTTTFNLMAATDAVKNRYLTTVGRAVGYLSDAEVERVIADVTGLTPVVYDKQYRDESKVAAKFVPDNYVAILPNGAVGQTWHGTTPEEADLYGNGASKAQVAIVNTGVAITQILDEHPVNLNTFASEIVLPSFEGMDDFVLIKVA